MITRKKAGMDMISLPISDSTLSSVIGLMRLNQSSYTLGLNLTAVALYISVPFPRSIMTHKKTYPVNIGFYSNGITIQLCLYHVNLN